MIEPVKRMLLRLLRVPPEPHPPSGSPGSTVIFRASKNYYYYNLLGWGFKQVGALAAVVGLLTLGLAATVGSRVPWGSIPVPQDVADAVAEVQEDPEAVRVGGKIAWWLGSRLWTAIELFGLIFLIVQAPITYTMVRLDYEMRWYIVTDRSMRIREGIVSVREMTMTFANIQNLTIRQGPLQRLLKISDLRVRTAGGGSGEQGEDKEDAGGSMHLGYLRGVDQAHEIRDAILARLKVLKDAGLGDPDDAPLAPADAVGSDVLAAARDLLGEARALRHCVSRSS
jgi:membrane protein YdbS with pleckstrin-like domain